MSGKSRDLSTEWSDWIWSEEDQCNFSTRSGPNGELEYSWQRPETPRYEGEWPSENTQPLANTPPDVYTTSSAPQTYKTTSYNIPSQYAQQSSVGSSSQAMNTLTQGFGGLSVQPQGDLPEVEVLGLGGQRKIAREIKSSYNNNASNVLNDRYVEIADHKGKKFWKRGRVFMMLWTEPARSRGTLGSQYSTVWLGEPVYSEIRRFVVIGEGHGNVICSPIHTYNRKGTLKDNLPDRDQHAVIYTSSKVPPKLCIYDERSGDLVAEEQLSKDPIRVIRELNHADGDLGDYSRVNYAKIYTVEKYCKVQNIGRVHDDSMESLLASCFFARPEGEPPQGPRKHKSTHRSEHRDDTSDTRGQSSKSGRHRRH